MEKQTRLRLVENMTCARCKVQHKPHHKPIAFCGPSNSETLRFFRKKLNSCPACSPVLLVRHSICHLLSTASMHTTICSLPTLIDSPSLKVFLGSIQIRDSACRLPGAFTAARAASPVSTSWVSLRYERGKRGPRTGKEAYSNQQQPFEGPLCGVNVSSRRNVSYS